MSHSISTLQEETTSTVTLKTIDRVHIPEYPPSRSTRSDSPKPEGKEGIIILVTGRKPLIIKILSGVKDLLTTQHLRLMDLHCLVFLMVISIGLLIFHRSVPNWEVHFLRHLFYALAILVTIGILHRLKPTRMRMALRLLYPVAIISYGWSELTHLGSMIYGNYWATDWIVATDKLLFGVYPTIWFQNWYHPWLDELMNLCYSGYYLYMPLILISLFLKKQYQDLSQVLSIATWTYLSIFLLYYLIPVLGPRMTPLLQAFPHREYSGYYVAGITRLLQSNGGIMGGAFPSSHVAGGVMWTLVCLKYFKKAGLFMIPLTLGMTISTVYLGYHHGLDPIAGLVWGIFSYLLISRLYQKFPGRTVRGINLSSLVYDRHNS